MSLLSRLALRLAHPPAIPTGEALLLALLSMEAAEARDTAARAKVARDTRPAPDGWADLANVR
jgi:hypothetical protein